MKTRVLTILGGCLLMTAAACTSHNQEKAKAEARDDAHQVAADAKKAGAEIKAGAKDLAKKVDSAVKPDSEKASDKMSEGVDQMKDAGSKAGVKLDHAALLAKVKTKLASDAGMSTLTKIDVSVDGSIVTLSGSVANEDQKKAAATAASQVDGVTRVHNNLVVEP